MNNYVSYVLDSSMLEWLRKLFYAGITKLTY